MAMALDEPKKTDEVYEVDGFTYLIDKEFMDKAKPIKVDFMEVGFKLTSAIEFGPGGCGGCSTSGACDS